MKKYFATLILIFTVSFAEDYAGLSGSFLRLGMTARAIAMGGAFTAEKDHNYADDLFEKMGIKNTDFVVSLSPVSRQPYKVWPAERFALIADWLIKTYNAKVLFHKRRSENDFSKPFIGANSKKEAFRFRIIPQRLCFVQ